MGESFKGFAVGAGSALAAEFVSNLIRSLRIWRKDDETRKHEITLTNEIRLARATIKELPKGQTIRNKHVKAWRSDLIEAAKEGDTALQSWTSDAAALKNAITKLQHLTRDANSYLRLLEFGNKKEALNSVAAAYRVNHELALTDHYKKIIKSYVARNSAPAAAAGGNPETLIGGTMYYSHPLEQFGFPKLEKKEPLNSAAAAADNPERLIAPKGTIYYQYPLEWYAFPKSEEKEKEPLNSAAAGGKPEISLSINPSRRPCVSSEDHHYLNKKRMSSESSSRPTMLEMVNPTASKKQRVLTLGDSLGEELQKNSSWPYDSTNKALIYNGEPSICDRMKMKGSGKCPEGELDEETGHGKANTPTLSCSPSSSYGGASDHIPPSCDGTPGDNDA